MNEHTVIEHLGNLGVILLAVLVSTSVHYLYLEMTRLWKIQS